MFPEFAFRPLSSVFRPPNTVKSWLSILEASGIAYLLAPYHTNVTKRLVKTSKLYILDTGLCAYLTEWTSPETLEASTMSGAILETWVVTELLKATGTMVGRHHSITIGTKIGMKLIY